MDILPALFLGLQLNFSLIFLGSVCSVEKTHISKWIQTDSKYPWNVYVFETLLNKGLNHCVENCKARKKCEYINFRIRASACYLIGIDDVIDGDTLNAHPERIQTKIGYVFGKKQEWNLSNYETCSLCETDSYCEQDGQIQDKFEICLSSGCGPPEHKAGTDLYGNIWSIRSKIEYHCKVGFTDVVKSTGSVTCQDSGNWSATSIKCVPDAAVRNVFMDSYYLFDTTNKRNWQEGKAYCEDLGGHLADIKTSDEMEYVTTLFEIYPDSWAWLGANDIWNNGSWMWSDGTSVEESYNAWKPGEPSQNDGQSCMVTRTVYVSGSRQRVWAAALCTIEFRSICEI